MPPPRRRSIASLFLILLHAMPAFAHDTVGGRGMARSSTGLNDTAPPSPPPWEATITPFDTPFNATDGHNISNIPAGSLGTLSPSRSRSNATDTSGGLPVISQPTTSPTPHAPIDSASLPNDNDGCDACVRNRKACDAIVPSPPGTVCWTFNSIRGACCCPVDIFPTCTRPDRVDACACISDQVGHQDNPTSFLTWLLLGLSLALLLVVSLWWWRRQRHQQELWATFITSDEYPIMKQF
ncbi:Aste57867_11203 [Aphanomyces stellatus]|uniref:Aste57867_11203 protein n=1 Tax=Aphanomyces stellatus TaxID=120398 RepID=A0A485KSR8_9STRA|nr:hypothetical protein As57867_011161 [Aphanomyces stellatus]VFT88070.1 Aste57867_11203 [Aphanomyces stellatus]